MSTLGHAATSNRAQTDRPRAELCLTEEFGKLVRTASRRPLLRREIDESLVPAGYDPDEVWRALTAMRHASAYVNPFVIHNSLGTLTEWFTTPASLQHTLERIGALTRRGSQLDSMVGERDGSHFVTQPYIEEILSNLRYDGFPSDYESIRAVLLGERGPMGTAERLALNFHESMLSLGDLADRPIGPGVIRELHARLSRGIDPEASPECSPSYPVDNYGGTHAPLPTLDDALAFETDLCCGRLTEPTLHDILLSLLTNCFFWRYSPFGRFDNFIGCSVSRLFLYKAGYPVFRYVPKASLYERWRAGSLDRAAGYTYEESVVPFGNTRDYTARYDSLMKLMLDSVEKMTASLGLRKQSDDSAIADIPGIPYLNHRQQEVLRQAVLRPDVEFRVRAHQELYGVAHSTARSDLVRLAELGLLSQGTRGSANVYYPSPHMKELIARLAGPQRAVIASRPGV